MVITPEESSPTKADTPSFAELKSLAKDGTATLNETIFFFETKCVIQIMQPTTGERAVASAAPAIPIPSGNISTQSITILKSELTTVATIAVDGAPSFRTNALQT